MIEHFSEDELETFARHVERKINVSYTVSSKRGFFLQLSRAIIYLFRGSAPSAAPVNDKKIDVSLPYFRQDLIRRLVPETTVSIDQLSLRTHEKIAVLCNLLVVTMRLRKIKVANKDLVLSSVLVGYVYFKRIEATRTYDIFFHYYAFVHDAYSLIYLLSASKRHRVTYVELSSFIDETMGVSCDVYSSRFELVSHFAERWEGVRAKKFVHRIPNERLTFKDEKKSERPKIIAFYSSSFYARLEDSQLMQEVLLEGQKRENEILSLLKAVVTSDANFMLQIFYHTSRGVDSIEKAKDHYRDFLIPDKVVLMKEGHDALTNMNAVSVGFTVISNVFWDCLLNNTRCFLYKPMFCSDLVDYSNISNVCVDRLSKNTDVLSVIRGILGESPDTFRRRLTNSQVTQRN